MDVAIGQCFMFEAGGLEDRKGAGETVGRVPVARGKELRYRRPEQSDLDDGIHHERAETGRVSWAIRSTTG